MTLELEVRGIIKRFSSLVANDHIDLRVERGEIRAIVGENGAGKTTLMNILYGLFQPDEGEIYVRGQRVDFRSPADSIRAGLGMVHQQFMLFPSLSVAENVIYGFEPTRYGIIDRKVAVQEIKELSNRYHMEVDPTQRVGNLPVGICQKVEILKALFRKANILILDEPTAVLTPQERDGLFIIMRGLREQGKTILFITHKLNEVMAISDNATVLRNGRVTAELCTKDTNPEEITRYIVGREVMLEFEKPKQQLGNEVLKLEGIKVNDEHGLEMVKDISFHIKGGEIVGVAGVSGNGQEELVEVIMGLRPLDGGAIHLEGKDISHLPLNKRRKIISYIPEDRFGVGSVIGASISENLIMGYQSQAPISKRWILRPRSIASFTYSLVSQFGIKVAHISESASNLSGGNLQKAVLARELSHGSPLVIADQPTRGLDVGSTEFVYKQLVDYRLKGKAVLLISADLNEIICLSDRILVMFEGQIVGEVPGGRAEENILGLMMTGAWNGHHRADKPLAG